MLALEVQVSEGRWVLEDQVLRWWYHVSGEGGLDKEVVLQATRRGGPIMGVLRGFGGMEGRVLGRWEDVSLLNLVWDASCGDL